MLTIPTGEESKNVTISVPPSILQKMDSMRGELISRHKIFLMALQEYVANHSGEVVSFAKKE